LTEHIYENANRNIHSFSSFCEEGANTYFNEVSTKIIDFNNVTNNGFKSLFLACYYPYFLYEYLINNIATNENDSMDSAPRFFFVQRVAILSVYMFLIYTLITITDNIDVTNQPENYDSSLTIMANINDRLFKDEYLIKNSDFHNENIQDKTEKTQNLSMTLYNQQMNINAVKNNLNKAALADTLLNPKYKKTKVIMILWSIFLGLVFIGLPLLLFLPMVDTPIYFWTFVGLISVVITISVITSLIKRS
jgi:hypothetical protein